MTDDLVTSLRQTSERLYSAALQAGRPHWMLLLHVHKSGGTTLRELAKRVNEVVDWQADYFRRVALSYGHTRCGHAKSSRADVDRCGVDEQLCLLQGRWRSVTFLANEHVGLSGAILLGLPLIYIASFRHPVARITSNWAHSCRSGERIGPLLDFARSRDDPRSNEYTVRYFAGLVLDVRDLKAMGVPLQAVGHEELMIAKRRLRVLSAIVILEQLDKTLVNLHRFGWPLSVLRRPPHLQSTPRCGPRGSPTHSDACRRAYLRYIDQSHLPESACLINESTHAGLGSAAAYAEVSARNRLSIDLYHEAVALALEQAAVRAPAAPAFTFTAPAVPADVQSEPSRNRRSWRHSDN